MSGLARAIKAQAQKALTKTVPAKRNGKLMHDELLIVNVTVQVPTKMPNGSDGPLEAKIVQMDGRLYGREGDTIHVMHGRPRGLKELEYYKGLPNYRGGPCVRGEYPISDIVNTP